MRLFSPAKVNLLLAVTGKREDGFHDLVSLVSPVSFGDFLTIKVEDKPGTIELSCSDPEVPLGEDNLVVQAARSFLQEIQEECGLQIHLEKKIPMEAGLGGGSSNAATVLLLLNQFFNEPLGLAELVELAAGIGSDCPLFLHRTPVVMRGRGERIEPLEADQLSKLQGRFLALFRPSFGISTAWAYQSLAADPGCYANAEEIEARLLAWRSSKLTIDELLMNSFEGPVFTKYLAFPALFEWIREALDLPCLMSGSGSCSFAILDNESQFSVLEPLVREAWGDEALIELCQLGVPEV